MIYILLSLFNTKPRNSCFFLIFYLVKVFLINFNCIKILINKSIETIKNPNNSMNKKIK